MKKIICLVFLLLMPVFAFAASPEDTRGIEEDKRKSLTPTEVQQFPLAEVTEPRPEEENYAFLSQLYKKKVGSIADACRAISIVLGKEKECVQDSSPLTKGRTAYMLCQALGIKGGLWMRILGLNQRYALRELVYEGIMFPGNGRDLMSGKELIFTLNRAADYKARYHEK